MRIVMLILLLVMGVAAAARGQVLWSNPLDDSADLAETRGTGSIEEIDGRAALRIEKRDASGSAMRIIALPVEALRGQWVYLSADVKADSISDKPRDWNGVKLMLKIETPAGDRWPQAQIPTGSFGWQRLSTRILIPDDARSLTLFLGMELVSGTVWFDDVRITRAKVLRNVPPAPRDQPIFRGHDLPRLRGAMVHPRMTREDLEFFARQWNGNLIRWQLLRLPEAGKESDFEDYDRWLAEELTHLDQVLRWAEELGVMVVVDLHSPPGGPISGGWVQTGSGPFWASPDAQAHFVKVWQRMAARYKGNDVIWGFDLMNEPDDRTVVEGCDDWQTLAERAGRAIREIDPDRTLIVEPPHWGSADGFAGFEPIDLPNVVYSFHLYTPFEYTHQGVHAPADPIAYPGQINGRMWDKDAIERSIQPAVAFADRYRVHMYVGEFSAIRWAPGAERWLADVIAIFEKHGWDWSYHAYREWHGWSLEHGIDRNDQSRTADSGRRQQAVRRWFDQNQRAR